MQLTNIIKLYNDMVKQGKLRVKFLFIYNHVEADVFFFIDENPMRLVFGIKHNNKYFELKLDNNFTVKESFDGNIYDLIIKSFNIKYDPEHKFKPIDFLTAFNKKIPQSIKNTIIVKPADIAKYKRDVEEADKIYFCGWRENSDKEHVSVKNLEKTKEYMGINAYNMSKQKNVSSRWTDDYRKDNFANWRNI